MPWVSDPTNARALKGGQRCQFCPDRVSNSMQFAPAVVVGLGVTLAGRSQGLSVSHSAVERVRRYIRNITSALGSRSAVHVAPPIADGSVPAELLFQYLVEQRCAAAPVQFL